MPRHPTEDHGGGAPDARVVWLRHAGMSARARHELDRVVAVAIAIADRDGLEALSMRRLATASETGTTTLYRYVRSRDELLELMADAVHEMDGLPDGPSGDWRADITAIAHATRAQYLRHPWLASLFVSMGPKTLRVADLVAATALRITPDVPTAEAIMSTLLHFVRGAAVGEIADRAARTAEREEAIATWERTVLANADHPAFARIAAADTGLPADARFAFGLARLLDGIAAHVAPAADTGP